MEIQKAVKGTKKLEVNCFVRNWCDVKLQTDDNKLRALTAGVGEVMVILVEGLLHGSPLQIGDPEGCHVKAQMLE